MHLSKILSRATGSRFAGFVLFVVLIQGCGDSRSDTDAGMSDAGRTDAGTSPEDAGPSDSSVIDDAGTADDSSVIDDAGVPDPDAGMMCTSPYLGDLVRGTNPAVFYISSDSERYVFPASREFMTWFADTSGVMTITDTELAAIPIGGNARIRPGTQLIKITTDPAVYAVTPCGIIRRIESELLATQLYGAMWAMRVVDIPDAFFINYVLGTLITTPVHPDGQLISYAGGTNVYLMDGGQRRLVSSRAFADSGFRTEFVIETTITYPDGPPYDCAEPRFQEVVCVTCGCPAP